MLCRNNGRLSLSSIDDLLRCLTWDSELMGSQDIALVPAKLKAYCESRGLRNPNSAGASHHIMRDNVFRYVIKYYRNCL